MKEQAKLLRARKMNDLNETMYTIPLLHPLVKNSKQKQ